MRTRRKKIIFFFSFLFLLEQSVISIVPVIMTILLLELLYLVHFKIWKKWSGKISSKQYPMKTIFNMNLCFAVSIKFLIENIYHVEHVLILNSRYKISDGEL